MLKGRAPYNDLWNLESIISSVRVFVVMEAGVSGSEVELVWRIIALSSSERNLRSFGSIESLSFSFFVG